MKNYSDCLILWVIDEAHQHEQSIGQNSIAQHMPDIETRKILVRDALPQRWYESYIKELQKTLAGGLDSGFQRFLFLDSDTYLCKPVYDIFDILEEYSVCSTHAPARQTTDMPDNYNIPDAYPEFNTGVFGYTNTSQVFQLFDWWLEEYQKMYDVSGDNDQACLRAAMWKQKTKAWVLPPEYNYRAGFGGFVSGYVRILHLRSQNIQAAARRVNAETGMRTFARGDIR